MPSLFQSNNAAAPRRFGTTFRVMRLPIARSIASLVVLSTACVALAESDTQPTPFHDDFESKTANPEWRPAINTVKDARRNETVQHLFDTPGAVLNLVKDPTDPTNTVVKFTITNDRADPKGPLQFRTELSQSTSKMGDTYWYSTRVLLPLDWQKDTQENIVAQWHARVGGDLDEGARNFPNLAISVVNNEYQYASAWDTDNIGFSVKTSGRKRGKLGTITPGKWDTFVINAKWTPKKDGFFRIWRNGEQMASYDGPTTYADKNGPYLKVGNYHPERKHDDSTDPAVTRDIVLYEDDVRVGRTAAEIDFKPETAATSQHPK